MVRILEDVGTDRILINSACDWGVSDPLKVAKTVAAMREAGFDEDDIDKVVWRNPLEFFAQSGRLILDDLGERDLAATFEGNTLLRGRALERAAPPPRRQPACTWRTAPTCIRPTTSTGSPRSWSGTPRACASALDVPVLGVGLWVAAPALADAARGRTGCARSSTGSGWRS